MRLSWMHRAAATATAFALLNAYAWLAMSLPDWSGTGGGGIGGVVVWVLQLVWVMGVRVVSGVLLVAVLRAVQMSAAHPAFPRVPVWLQSLNAVTALAGLDSWDAVELTFERCHALAIAQTGADRLTDFGDEYDGYAERFRRSLHALKTDPLAAPLSWFGRMGLRGEFVRRLHQRLRIVHLLKTHGDAIRAQRIVQPIVVTGLGRTGTSLIYRLMAEADPHRTPLYMFEGLHPALSDAQLAALRDPAQADWRVTRTETDMWFLHHFQAEHFDAIHKFDARLPEECLPLLMNSFAVTLQLPSFDDWLRTQSLGGAYDFYKLQLQLVLWQRTVRARALNPTAAPVQEDAPPHRLLLKYPGHSAHVDELVRIFPDVCVVWTQRPMRQVVPSMCSLLLAMAAIVSRPYDPRPYHGARTLHALQQAHVTALRKWGAVHDTQRFVAFYRDIVADPVAMVVRILAHFRMAPLDATQVGRLRAYMRTHGQDAHGQHKYSAATYGISDAQIDAAFADVGLDGGDTPKAAKPSTHGTTTAAATPNGNGHGHGNGTAAVNGNGNDHANGDGNGHAHANGNGHAHVNGDSKKQH